MFFAYLALRRRRQTGRKITALFLFKTSVRYNAHMKKRLERDEEKAVISGVLAGMANYFEQDPVLFRIAAIAFLILTGFFPGILIYILAWIIMPRRNTRVEYEVVE